MKTYEVTGKGFDANSDETDDRVFWVKALNIETVAGVIAGTSAAIHGQIEVESDINFVLPEQAEELRSALMQFESLSHAERPRC